ncbi:MAG: aminomethyltransferase family protein, partial [Alphaproteobacteria bacterium]
SPLYDRLAAAGAEFGSYGGWERADWFPKNHADRRPADSYDRQHWFDTVGEECRHVAAHAGILELTGFSRFHLKGDGAADWLASLVTGNLPRVGRIGLVYIASAKGKVLTEMSATRLAEDEFLLITGAGAYWHDRDLLNRSLPDSGHITLTDTTRDYATLLVTGPKSPAIIAAASGISTAHADFPWLSHQPCQIAGCGVAAIRVSFAGEAGWEIHCDMADVVAVYDAIMAAGAPHQLGHFGMLALDSMRLEKGYRSWKSDLTSDYTMLESGLGRWVKFDKDDFVGRAALQAEHQAGSQRQFVMLTLDDPVDGNTDPFGEAVYLSVVQCDGVDSGLVVSSGYGHRVNKSIAMAVVDTDKLASASQITVTVLGRPRAAHLVPAHALYDPNNEKLRG